MVERMNPALPISQQCRLLALPRSSVYRKPVEVSAEDIGSSADGAVLGHVRHQDNAGSRLPDA